MLDFYIWIVCVCGGVVTCTLLNVYIANKSLAMCVSIYTYIYNTYIYTYTHKNRCLDEEMHVLAVNLYLDNKGSTLSKNRKLTTSSQ